MPRPALRIPAELEWLREGEPGGAEWLEGLPELAAECAVRWNVALGEPLPGAQLSLVLPAGENAVLKLNFPHDESRDEGGALRHWDGAGAVRLLAEDRERRVVLIERCRPGTRLWDVPDGDEPTLVAAGVLRALHARPAPRAHPFRLLADEAARWREELPERWQALGRPFARALLETALAFLGETGPDDQMVLHQDLHGGNVLRSERGWLAIDPKPLVGERGFDAASFLRDRRAELARDPDARARVRRRLDVLAAELSLDRDRMRGWAVVHALAWGLGEETAHTELLACAALLAEA